MMQVATAPAPLVMEPVSNLMCPELWQKARRVMGVQGPVGWMPSLEEESERQMQRQYRERSLKHVDLANLPPVSLVSHALKLIDQPGMTFSKLEELLRQQVTGAAIDTSDSFPKANMLRLLGVEMLRISPQVPSGRQLRFRSSRQSKDWATTIAFDADTLFVIPNFSSFWKVPKAGRAYQAFYRNTLTLKHLHFVGTAAKLFSLLELIEYHLQPTIDILPPWRTAYAWKQALTQGVPQLSA
ncbi:hypothetical protein DIPPA_16468 [Diplonema papillatum]|nr:hypothetical protein DIPPA_16468 [Diplonema papillatum]KAJ9450083.1 hypothetical protein DIPPA_16468 [Diplonema papillatum]